MKLNNHIVILVLDMILLVAFFIHCRYCTSDYRVYTDSGFEDSLEVINRADIPVHDNFGDAISDANTAVRMGGAILDDRYGMSIYHICHFEITCDPESNLWKVEKNYLFRGGGYCILDGKTGSLLEIGNLE